MFNIRVLDGTPEGTLIDPLVEHPLYMEAVDHALSLCDEDVPPHIKLHLEWEPQNVQKYLLHTNLRCSRLHGSLTMVHFNYQDHC